MWHRAAPPADENTSAEFRVARWLNCGVRSGRVDRKHAVRGSMYARRSSLLPTSRRYMPPSGVLRSGWTRTASRICRESLWPTASCSRTSGSDTRRSIRLLHSLLVSAGYVGMVPAAYVLTVLSGALLALAFAALMRYAANDLDLGPGWRLLIAGLCGCGPLLAMGFNMGNVSLAASALCFLAFVRRKSGSPWMPRSSPWIPGAALALAFLLKPHLGLWAGIGMLLLPERAARAVAVRAIALATGFAVLSAGCDGRDGNAGHSRCAPTWPCSRQRLQPERR